MATRKRTRSNDPEGVKRDIVEVATREFARLGYSGAKSTPLPPARAPASG